ncbi:uncharacterized protein [Triticum aestivum]|uniref:uncharacterized protein n=1 Tax=Triticum aestivum TaxID=4565 RepID=UPI001D00DA46|nr:uncharacterized protein LOC123044830 [Triticum aestivum]
MPPMAGSRSAPSGSSRAAHRASHRGHHRALPPTELPRAYFTFCSPDRWTERRGGPPTPSPYAVHPTRLLRCAAHLSAFRRPCLQSAFPVHAWHGCPEEEHAAGSPFILSNNGSDEPPGRTESISAAHQIFSFCSSIQHVVSPIERSWYSGSAAHPLCARRCRKALVAAKDTMVTARQKATVRAARSCSLLV